MLYRIAWRSLRTGATGQGTTKMVREFAQEVADKLNKKWIDYDHWIEPVDEKEPIDNG